MITRWTTSSQTAIDVMRCCGTSPFWGEAVGQLSNETKDAYPSVAWAATVRMRNRIVHGYWSIDLDVLLATAADDLPAFLGDVRDVLARVSSEDGLYDG